LARSGQINRYNIETLELLRSAYSSWNAIASTWDRPIGFHLVELDFTRVEDPQERRRLNQMPTSLGLDAEQVGRLRSAARSTLKRSSEWNTFLQSVAVEGAARRENPAGR